MPPKKKSDVKAGKADKLKAGKNASKSKSPEKAVSKSKSVDKAKVSKSNSKDIKP